MQIFIFTIQSRFGLVKLDCTGIYHLHICRWRLAKAGQLPRGDVDGGHYQGFYAARA